MILFVDDEPFYVDSYVQELQEEGFTVSFNRNAADAARACEGQMGTVDLVITDVVMPENGLTESHPVGNRRTGVVFYDWIRSRTQKLPIIVLTGSSDPELDRVLAPDRNCRLERKYSCMPFELAEIVREMLKGPAGGPPGDSSNNEQA